MLVLSFCAGVESYSIPMISIPLRWHLHETYPPCCHPRKHSASGILLRWMFLYARKEPRQAEMTDRKSNDQIPPTPFCIW
jgi:hypothetical protein